MDANTSFGTACGTPLPANTPEGLCPKCLLDRGLNLLADPQSMTQADAPTEASASVTPLTGAKLRYFGDYELLEEIREVEWESFSRHAG